MYVTSPCRGGWVPANHPLARQGTPGGGGNPKPAPGVFELRAAEGILLAADPAAFPAVTDGAPINATIGFRFDGTVDNSQPLFRATFPCLQAPLRARPHPGSTARRSRCGESSCPRHDDTSDRSTTSVHARRAWPAPGSSSSPARACRRTISGSSPARSARRQVRPCRSRCA